MCSETEEKKVSTIIMLYKEERVLFVKKEKHDLLLFLSYSVFICENSASKYILWSLSVSV